MIFFDDLSISYGFMKTLSLIQIMDLNKTYYKYYFLFTSVTPKLNSQSKLQISFFLKVTIHILLFLYIFASF